MPGQPLGAVTPVLDNFKFKSILYSMGSRSVMTKKCNSIFRIVLS